MNRDKWRNIARTLLTAALRIGCFWFVLMGSFICGIYNSVAGNVQYTPTPVSSTGRRRLSIIKSSKPDNNGLRLPQFGTFSSSPHTIDQTQFSFLFSKLSPEIRLMIYKEVLGNYIIHIGLCPGGSRRERGRMAHIRCPWRVDDGRTRWRYRGCKLRQIPRYSDNRVIDPVYRPSSPHEMTTKGLLALLKTCRQIYTEAIDTLYSCNIFDLGPEETAYLFLNSILPRQRDAIRILQFHHKHSKAPTSSHARSKAWYLISRMKGLRSVHVLTLSHCKWMFEEPVKGYAELLSEDVEEFKIYTKKTI